MWSSQAEAEGLTLLVADNKTGYLTGYSACASSSPASPSPIRRR